MTLAMFRGVGEGLAAAHAAGIVHRDVKPDNIFVDRDGVPHVGDFGIALVGPDGTPTVAGTPAYMALEQHRGKAVDARADQFAFAVALYEAACGVHPFGDGNPIELVAAIAGHEIEPPRRPVPSWLVRALRRALDADPAQRYPDMRALLHALRERTFSRRAVVGAAVAFGFMSIALGAGIALHRGPPTVWDEPVKVGNAPPLRSAVAPVSWDGNRIDLFGIGADGLLWHTWTPGNMPWANYGR